MIPELQLYLKDPREIASNKVLCWIGRRRGLLVSLLGAVAVADALWGSAQPVRFFGEGASPYGPWLLALVLLGVAIRVWGAGNLKKNAEVTRTGVYCMVRHPLYLGNNLIYLAFFLSLGDMAFGLVLFALVFLIHYPAIFREERRLANDYPGAFAAHGTVPRLVPDLRAFPAAVTSDCFCPRRALRNRAVRSFWALSLPLVTELLIRLKEIL